MLYTILKTQKNKMADFRLQKNKKQNGWLPPPKKKKKNKMADFRLPKIPAKKSRDLISIIN
jgi:hypothetical protein